MATLRFSTNTVQFRDLSVGNPVSWLWDFGDESATSSSRNPTHVFPESETTATYTTTLTVADAFGRSSKIAKEVEIAGAVVPSGCVYVLPDMAPAVANAIFDFNTEGTIGTFDSDPSVQPRDELTCWLSEDGFYVAAENLDSDGESHRLDRGAGLTFSDNIYDKGTNFSDRVRGITRGGSACGQGFLDVFFVNGGFYWATLTPPVVDPDADWVGISPRATLLGAAGLIRTIDGSEADFAIPTENGFPVAPLAFNICDDAAWARGFTVDGDPIPFLLTKNGPGDWTAEVSDTPAGMVETYPIGMSGDGKRRIGYGWAAGFTENSAFLWDESLTPTDLGTVNAHTQTCPWAISGDGTIVVGSAGSGGNAATDAWIWTDAGGMQLLADYFTGKGLDTSAYDLRIGMGVSGNGKHFLVWADPAGVSTARRLLYIVIP